VTRRAVEPSLKYLNWIVSLFLFLLGVRVLFVIASYAMNANVPRPEKPLVMLGETAGSIAFILAAVGVFEWRNWGRRLAIVICALNVLGTIYSIATLGPGMRLRLFIGLGTLVLVLVWFFLPKVRAQFKNER
jgi:hypothetical protein